MKVMWRLGDVTNHLNRRSGGPHYILRVLSAYAIGRVSRWFLMGIDKPDMAASGGMSHRVRQVILIRDIGIQSEQCKRENPLAGWQEQSLLQRNEGDTGVFCRLGLGLVLARQWCVWGSWS